MDWIRHLLLRWGRGWIVTGDRARGHPMRVPRSVEAWEHRLIADGISSEWAPTIARRLDALLRELGPDAAPALRGAALAVYEVQTEAQNHVEQNLRDVREVERMLGAFSGELKKLDEVLEVLSAYAQRMRTPPARRSRHTLH